MDFYNFCDQTFVASATSSLAKCLAALKPTPEKKFDRFWKLMPQVNSSGFIDINSRSKDVVLALGIYFLECEFQFTDRIFPYLVNIACNFTKIKWKIDDIEGFVYAIHILLGDIAAKINDIKMAVIGKQVQMFKELVNDQLHVNAAVKCSILLGLIRAMGRSSSKECLFKNAISTEAKDDYLTYDQTCKCKTLNMYKDLKENTSEVFVFRSTDSNFDEQLPEENEKLPESGFLFCGLLSEIDVILKNVSVLLRKDLPDGFNQKLRLRTIGLLRRLMCDQIRPLQHCLTNMRCFAEEIYAQIIFSLTYTVSLDMRIEIVSSTCGDCLLLLEWTTTNEMDAEQLLERLRTITDGRFNEKAIVVLAPVLSNCFRCIANVAGKYPGLKDKCAALLKNYLLEPKSKITTFMSNRVLKDLIKDSASALSQVLQRDNDGLLELVMELWNKSFKGTRIVAENAIVALSILATKLSPCPLSLKIINILEQNLYRASDVVLHSLVIRHLGEIAVAHVTFATFKQLVSLLTQLTSEPYLWPDVVDALTIIARDVDSFYRQQKLLLGLFELFVRLALRDATPDRAVHLIAVINVLIQRVPRVSKPEARLRKLFHDFWLCVIVFRLPDSSALGNIAVKSPTLARHEIIHHDPIFKDNNVLKKIIITKYELLPLRQSAFLMSVHRLESLRVRESNADFGSFFMYYYLESISKSHILPHMFDITDIIFATVVSTLKARHLPSDDVVEQYVIYLVVKSNYPLTEVRESALKYLKILYKEFPCVFWRRDVIWAMLDILQLLSGTLDVGPREERVEARVPRTNFTLVFADNPDSRQVAIQKFEQLCRKYLTEAISQTPDTVQSHLQEYAASRPKPFETLHCHFGISLTIESIIEPAKRVSLHADFIDALTLRCRYAGELAAILEQGPEAVADLKLKLLDRDDKHSIFLLTGLIISMPKPDRKLLYKLCQSPLSESRTHSLTCWLWLISARPDLEILFLCYMSSVWHETAVHRRGLFSEHSLLKKQNVEWRQAVDVIPAGKKVSDRCASHGAHV